MKTLADLKRDLKIGDSITLVESPDRPNNSRLNIRRYIVKKQGNGVYLSENKNADRGSFLELPNAKLVEYDGKEIRIYYPDDRPLTDKEQRVWDNRPSQREENKKQWEYDMLSGSNVLFWKDKAYFKNQDMGYLYYEKNNRYVFHSQDMIIAVKDKRKAVFLRYIINQN